MAGNGDTGRAGGDYGAGDGSDRREAGLILLFVVLALSFGAHVWLMHACSGLSFAPLPENVKGAKAWTTSNTTANVRMYAEDPLAALSAPELAPIAPPPEAERHEERVERLAEAAGPTLAPEPPGPDSTPPEAAAGRAEPPKVPAAAWKPRQKIAEVEAPTVPDEKAAIPRLVTPRVARVSNAEDIVPPYELLRGAAQFEGSAGAAEAGAAAPPGKPLAGAAEKVMPKAPPAIAPAIASAAQARAGEAAGSAPTLAALTAEESAAIAKTLDARKEEREAAKRREEMIERERKRPVPPAPKTIEPDARAVESSRDAVRMLRDDAEAVKAFDANVRFRLGSWTDPADPRHKYFRITASADPEKPLPVVSKDIVFLLDASGSIANDRLKRCRKAFVKALRLLNTGDRFNVVAFRDRFTFAFPETAWTEVTEETLEKAEDWLGTLTAHGQTDVFATLKGVLAMPRDPARPVVAFVVTDGDATSGMTRSADIVSKFSELNGGLVSVYMYGVKDSANAYLMDMLTRSNRGTWARNEKLRWNAADGIPELAKKFERPVLTDISMLFSASSKAETYPRLAANLCLDAPLEVYGRCPAGQNEVVFSMRGLNGTQVYDGLVTLPFANAEALGADAKKTWATHRIYAMAAEYSAKPSPKLMAEMRAFAERHGVGIPYERQMR